MKIINGIVYKDTFQFEKQDLHIENGCFSKVPQNSNTVVTLDATNCYVIPGLIDIHLHGANGYDFCDATFEAIQSITQFELSHGITTIFPTTMTLSTEKTCKILEMLANFMHAPSEKSSYIAGIHLEGPYISPQQCGAQDATWCRSPHLSEFYKLQKAADYKIQYLTLAPEQAGALDFIQSISSDVIVSLGHTIASYDTALYAFQKGASHLTHCYNAMPPLHHRDPGVIGAALDYGHIYTELICDGLHLHPATIRLSFQLFDDDHIIFISDSTMATGLPDGIYTLGGSPIQVTHQEARTPSGQLAGSTTHLMDCLRKAVDFGIPLEKALKCVTANPAREVGIYHQLGSITTGKQADCVILNQNLEVIHVIQRGHLIF
ncbi:MAG: N-acetylglucosamine-6-phosphate deacetylase [Cellulosilyticum sp.]|nr:N-acetylglucosamine-6-phosphate deacetylase [Cellulosilyticum sp.]